MQKEDNEHGCFTVKYSGTANPLQVNFPANEYKGSKYIDLEIGAFFWEYQESAGIGVPLSIPLVLIKVPGVSSGNYDITGNNSNIVTMICPENYTTTTNMVTWYRQSHFTYSPGRPDLYIVPPSPFIVLEITDLIGNLINFTGNPYYISLNIGY